MKNEASSRLPPRRATVLDVYVGQRIKERREELGLSQEALAGRLGLSFQQLQKYERGTNRVSAGRLFELTQALEVSLTFFFKGMEDLIEHADRPPAAGSTHVVTDALGVSVSTPGAEDLLRAYTCLTSQTQRDKAIQIVKLLRE